ncbi:anti-sigma factor [Paragemmobacter straminiformis]|uniref:Anti-sigma factor n=1 Tax=Paragemmobacter straminiformis TaxID=2045119 RepID=A0A842I8V9_9RHOB|nr:anti-sigma factor [Gemmobacter straminiformis]MBC2835428.1 anti-sigma factor [Gemmobacter straminiformis]
MTSDDLAMTPQDKDDVLAAEYVLGVLDLPERLSVETRAKTDTAFAARITAWENRLADLNGGFAEAPAPNLLPQIEARLFGTPAPRRRPLFGWLAGAIAAAAVAIAAVALLVPPAPAPLVATLGAEADPLRFEARHDGQTLVVTRVAGTPAPAGQVQELWIIAPDAAPVSLGLLTDAPLAVAYPDTPEGWTLAVSLEPEGGSPTGAPTGPVLAAGTITDL